MTPAASLPAGFTLSFPTPLDLAASLGGLSRGGDDLLDRWDGTTMVRTTRVEGRPVAFSASPVATRMAGNQGEPTLRVAAEERSDQHTRDAVAGTIGSMFVRDEGALAQLVAVDPVIAAIDRATPGLRPVLWADPFTALVRSISAQQVNLAWAATTRARLAIAFGHRHQVGGHWVHSLDPARLAAAQIDDLRALQLSGAKAAALTGVARAATEGALDLGQLQAWPDEEVIAHLRRLRGIGRWSADWFLARTLGRPVVVAGDLGVRKAVGAAYLGGRLPSESEARQVTAHWGRAAGMAQQLLLSTSAASTRAASTRSASTDRAV